MLQKKIKKAGSNLTADRVRGELFYGWVTAIAGAGVTFTAGSFHYSFGVFVKPLIDRFGWSRATISSVASLRSLISAVSSPIAGTLSDRYGARKLILVAICLCGLGYLLSSQAISLWHLYLFFSTLMGVAGAVAFVPVIATVTRWFGGKSTLASGITYSGFSLAQMLLPPAVTYLFGQYGWETCLIVLGVAVWLLGTLFWSFIKNPPSAVPNQPTEPTRVANTNEANEPQTPDGSDYTLSEAMHTFTFWLIFFIYIIIAICFQMIIAHIVVAAIDVGVAAGAAAIILTVIGIGSTLGRLVVGGLADKIGARNILAMSLALQVPALFVLARVSNLGTFYLVGAIYGVIYGGTVPIMPTLAGSFFGMKAVGAIIGTLTLVHMLGATVGPLLAGYVFDITGSYYIAFSAAAIAIAVAFLFCLLLKPPRRKIVAP